MAQRRMLSKKITDTDAFLDMPLSAQCLYFHLNMDADDDGFIGNAKTVRRKVGASEDDFKLLIAKQFLLPFEASGVVVVRDWRIHNYIRSDRYTKTVYKDEKQQLTINENGRYERISNQLVNGDIPLVCQMDTKGIPTGYTGKDRLGKDRLGKDRLGIDTPGEPASAPAEKKKKILKHKHGEYSNVLLTDQELSKLKDEFTDWSDRIERLSSYMASTGKTYKNHLATIRNWAKREKEQLKQPTLGPNPVFRPQQRVEVVPEWMGRQYQQTDDLGDYHNPFSKSGSDG